MFGREVLMIYFPLLFVIYNVVVCYWLFYEYVLVWRGCVLCVNWIYMYIVWYSIVITYRLYLSWPVYAPSIVSFIVDLYLFSLNQVHNYLGIFSMLSTLFVLFHPCFLWFCCSCCIRYGSWGTGCCADGWYFHLKVYHLLE